MNDTSSATLPPASSDPASAAPPVVVRGGSAGTAWLALVLALASLGAAAWVWSDTRERNRDLRAEVSRALADAEKQASETRILARNADDAMRQASERVGHLETQFNNAQQQQVAIEALYKDMAQARDNWTVSEIEPVLAAAAQQLQLAGNVRAAIVALETVDTNLASRDLPQFGDLRRAVAGDLAKLRATPEFDTVGVSARLDALAGRIPQLPLAGDEATSAPEPGATAGKGLWNELLGELKSIVQIRRVDSSEGVLLPPSQAYYLRENLRLRLLAARLGVLARDQVGYRDDLVAADGLLAQHFDARSKAVVAARDELKQLSALMVAPRLPDLEASLAALADYKAAH